MPEARAFDPEIVMVVAPHAQQDPITREEIQALIEEAEERGAETIALPAPLDMGSRVAKAGEWVGVRDLRTMLLRGSQWHGLIVELEGAVEDIESGRSGVEAAVEKLRLVIGKLRYRAEIGE